MDLKKASSLSKKAKKVERYFYIAEAVKLNPSVSLSKLCKSFDVSRSGFYTWKNRAICKHDLSDLKLINSIFELRKRKAGIRTIKMILLKDHNKVMNLKKIARIKNKYGLETVIRRRSKNRIIAKGGSDHKAVPNLVKRKFNIRSADRIYSTDITYLNYGNGQRAYLSAVKDLGTKEIVHFSMSKSIHMELATQGLDELFRSLTPEKRKRLIIHSDQGSHYTTKGFREKLQEYSINQSMSRKGNCLDNAPIESFFGHMKDEVELRNCMSYPELESRIKKYIHFYNNQRPQWGLKQRTPAECRRFLNRL